MFKIDLHIHTDPISYEEQFNFSLDTLKKYVKNNKLNVIAITNHNHFNKEQFIDIKKELNNTTVLPGVEIDIEDSHLLLIGSEDDIDDISLASQSLSEKIKNKNDYISFEQFKEIFPNYKKYILIPHFYGKRPKMKMSTINKFNGHIFCGEASSVKKFVTNKESGKLVPVFFSDIRIKDEKDEVFPVRNTYIDINKFEFSTLKEALADKNKVFINDRKEDCEIEILPDGTTASSKLNVLLGKRSSGKTFNLDRIYKSLENNNIKYIKQFSLTGSSEKTKFDDLVKEERMELINDHLLPFKQITNRMLDIEENFDNNIIDYLSSLKEYADSQIFSDVYSKAKLFNEDLFQSKDNYDTKNIIESVVNLLETQNNRDIIVKFINNNTLISLLKELLNKRTEEYLKYKLKNEVDRIIECAKDKLSEKSAIKRITEVDLYSSAKDYIMINKYNELCDYLKKDALIKEIDVHRFKIKFIRKAYTSSKDIKNNVKNIKITAKNFKLYDNSFKYIQSLSEQGIDRDLIYKAVINCDVSIINEKGSELSGGERAEYNLLRELEKSYDFDILLLDEPEASFDNQFINDYIIKKIKDISNQTTVFLSTHNNTLGISLRPNKIIYTEAIDNTYKVYTGDFGTKYLETKAGEKKEAYDCLMNTMEAGEKIYNERKRIYENIKN